MHEVADHFHVYFFVQKSKARDTRLPVVKWAHPVEEVGNASGAGLKAGLCL